MVLADAGYWHLEQMNEITGDGIPVLIPPDSSRRANKPTRPGWNGGAYDFMRSVLATELGAELYKQRGQLIEPIFGHTKHNRGFTRFHRRGRSAARTEWRLMATTHNLRQAPPALHRRGRLTATRPDHVESAGGGGTGREPPLRDSLRRLRKRRPCEGTRRGFLARLRSASANAGTGGAWARGCSSSTATECAAGQRNSSPSRAV